MVEQSLQDDSDDWKNEIPGRILLNRFLTLGGLARSNGRRLYVHKNQELNLGAFEEIEEIFRGFSAGS